MRRRVALGRGPGTVAGTAGYAFRVTATDAPDTFRIKIWKKSTGAVVYDLTGTAKVTGALTIGTRRR